MSDFRLSPPTANLFGPLLWTFIGLCIFGWLTVESAPTGEAAREIAAQAPYGFASYFASPETAAQRINLLLARRDFKHLAGYYDFTGSQVSMADVKSGAYFVAAGSSPKAGAIVRPFPRGYRFLYDEKTGVDEIVRVVVVDAPENAEDAASAPQASFLLRASPQGYRIVPGDGARGTSAASTP